MLHLARGQEEIASLLGPKPAQHVLFACILRGGKVLALVFNDEQPTIGEAGERVSGLLCICERVHAS